MQQQTLFRISLIIALIGIFFLLVLANVQKPKQVKIEEIDDKMADKKVTIQGEIYKVEDKQDFQILSVSDMTGVIDITCNCKEKIEKDQKIIAIGTIKKSKYGLEILADKIIRI